MIDHSQLIPEPSGQERRALEIGTGRGDFLTKLQSRGWEVVGIEPSAQAVEQARQSGHIVHHGTLEGVDFEEKSFDAIFAWMVLEHVVSPRKALDRVNTWLKPEGTFYFSVPNFGCLEPLLFGRYWIAWEAPRHLHQFTPTVLKRLLHEAGFQKIRLIHQRNVRDYYGSLGAWLLDRNPESRWGRKLMNWFADSPPLGVHVLLTPVALLLALLKQGGRLTVIARR